MFKATPLTNALISVIVAVYGIEVLWQWLYGAASLATTFGGLGFSASGLAAGAWWTFLTAPFLHAGPEHLILNALALFFFGRVVELELGWRKTLLIFLGAAFAGNLAVLAATAFGIMPAAVPTVGASGAIFGLIGAAMLLKPFEFVFYPYLIPIPLVVVAVLYTLYNVGAFLATTAGAESNIAYVAHLGGLAIGMLTGFWIEGARRGFLVLLLIAGLLLAIPLLWAAVGGRLEAFNWIALISKVLGH